MSNAIFIDSSSLNVLFKINGKFRVGLNYRDNPAQLIVDANALGSTYDVYISVWTRPAAEGQLTIDRLSIGGVPFCMLREEAEAVVALSDMFIGATNVYICNALANYATHTRVANFQSVFPIGNRFAFITVKDRMLESLKMYSSAAAFYEDNGDDFVCYGDMDLLSVESIKSQYPELSNLQKTELVPIIPIIASYNSAHKIELMELKALLDTHMSEKPKVKPKIFDTEPEESKVQEEEEFKLPDSDGKVPELKKGLNLSPKKSTRNLSALRKKKRTSSDAVVSVCFVVCCLLGVVLGIDLYYQKCEAIASTYTQPIKAYKDNVEKYKSLSDVYSAKFKPAEVVHSAYTTALENDLGVSVVSVKGSPEYTTLCFIAPSNSAEEAFLQYMSNKFDILDVGTLGEANDMNGNLAYKYFFKLLPRS